MSSTMRVAGKNLANADGVEEAIRSLFGSLLSADWRQALVARGFGWHVDVGTFSTPIVGGGNGTVLDADQPEFVIDVPLGTTLIPLRFDIACQTPLIAADSDESEICILCDFSAVSGATSTQGTVETPRSMRTNKTGGCPCSVVSAVTTNTTAVPTATALYELIHRQRVGDVQGTAANALWGELSALYEPRNPPFLVGPASVWGYWGGTVATTGFANLDFLAIDSALVKDLV